MRALWFLATPTGDLVVMRWFYPNIAIRHTPLHMELSWYSPIPTFTGNGRQAGPPKGHPLVLGEFESVSNPYINEKG